MSPSPQAVFVYGTLKRGECREHAWPQRPLAVEPAWMLGSLFDLGPYPAAIAGSDRILGEAWLFDADVLPDTLRVLDAIEGFRGRADDLYRRVVGVCTLSAGDTLPAFVYHFARPEDLASSQRIAADEHGFVRWPR